MDNFFNQAPEQQKVSIEAQYDNLKDNYKQIFVEAAESIRTAIDKFKPENPCSSCTIKCSIEKKDVFSDFPVGCPYRDWQKEVLSFLQGEYKQKLKNIYKMILDKRCNYECSCCGNCCRLTTSEYSYNQLKQRAIRGDKYATDFVSVFVPYETEEEAKQANPEYFKLLDEVSETQKVYYYHCPKLKDNKCSDYENRPDVCKEFPKNPLQLLPSTCSFNAWKNEVAKQSLLLNAKVDIIDFYKQKLG